LKGLPKKANKPKTQKNADERIKSTDYRKWDLYNVEEEVKKVDVEDENNEDVQEEMNEHDIERKKKAESYAKRLNKEKHIPAVSNEIKQKSVEELKALAEIEKNKGNDCYKSKDYEEALIYYTRSLDLIEMPNVYTNRALVNLKMSRFAEAEADATEALKMNDPKFNFKAYLRRGESYSRRARYREAINDFSEALKIEPDNKEAENLLIKAQQNYLDVEGELAEKLDVKIKESSKPSKPKKKMLIKEVDEIKDDDILLNTEKSLDNDNKKVEDIVTNKVNKYDDTNKKNEKLNINYTSRNENNSMKNYDIKNNKDKEMKTSNKKVLIEEINDQEIKKSENSSKKKMIIEEINNESSESNNEIQNEKLNNNLSKSEPQHTVFNNEKSKIEEISDEINETCKIEEISDEINETCKIEEINDKINDTCKIEEINDDEEKIIKEEEDITKGISTMETLKKAAATEDANNEKSMESTMAIQILSEEEEEEASIYSNYSEEESFEAKSPKNKVKFEPKQKNRMKSYIDSLKFYNEFEDEEEEEENIINGFNEEEIRRKLEKLHELKQYMNKKLRVVDNREDDDDDDNDETQEDNDENPIKNNNEDKNEINNNNDDDDIIVIDEEEEEEEGTENDYNDGFDSEELNYLEFLKAKEKERYNLYEKTMNNENETSNDADINVNVDEEDDCDLSDIYDEDDDDELLKVINNRLRQGGMDDADKNYISKLLKNRRSQASLGSDNSDFENYDYDSSN